MYAFEKTPFWKRTLGVQGKDDVDREARDELRAAFLRFRKQAESLAGEIARFLPEYTVHDIRHIDALWGTASTIGGPKYNLTPMEASCLARIIHGA